MHSNPTHFSFPHICPSPLQSHKIKEKITKIINNILLFSFVFLPLNASSFLLASLGPVMYHTVYQLQQTDLLATNRFTDFIVMSCWSGIKPLVSGISSILDNH